MMFRILMCLIVVAALGAQQEEPEPRLANGSSRNLMVLKKDVEKSRKDIAKLIELATELQAEIDQNDFHVVDLGSIRKVEEVEKLAKRIKSRMKRVQ